MARPWMPAVLTCLALATAPASADALSITLKLPTDTEGTDLTITGGGENDQVSVGRQLDGFNFLLVAAPNPAITVMNDPGSPDPLCIVEDTGVPTQKALRCSMLVTGHISATMGAGSDGLNVVGGWEGALDGGPDSDGISFTAFRGTGSSVTGAGGDDSLTLNAINTSSSPATVSGGDGNDTITMSADQAATIHDVVDGGAGNDDIRADIDDAVTAGDGDDTVDIENQLPAASPGGSAAGGLGSDLYVAQEVDEDVDMSLALVGGAVQLGAGDEGTAIMATTSGFESLEGDGNDNGGVHLEGDDGPNRLVAHVVSGTGVGLVNGHGGDDVIVVGGQPGVDTVHAGAGADSITASGDGPGDQIDCGDDIDTDVHADTGDVLTGCENGVSVTITNAPFGLTNTRDAVFEFELLTDSPPPGHIACRLDSGAFAQCSSPRSLSGLTDGHHRFEVRYEFDAGGAGVAEAREWDVDATAPTVSLQAPVVSGRSATVAFTASEGEVSFECSLDGAPGQGCASPFSAAGLADGAHTLAVRAIDKAGNAGPSASVPWTIACGSSRRSLRADGDQCAQRLIVVGEPAGEDQVTATGKWQFSLQGQFFDVGCQAPEVSASPFATLVIDTDRAGMASLFALDHERFELQTARFTFTLGASPFTVTRTSKAGTGKAFADAAAVLASNDKAKLTSSGNGIFYGARFDCQLEPGGPFVSVMDGPHVLCRNQSEGAGYDGLTATMKDKLKELYKVLDKQRVCHALVSGERTLAQQQALFDDWHAIADRLPGDPRDRDRDAICQELRQHGFIQCVTGWNAAGVGRNGPAQPGSSRHNVGQAADLRLAFGIDTGRFDVDKASRDEDLLKYFNALVRQVPDLCGSPASDPGHIELPYDNGDGASRCRFVDADAGFRKASAAARRKPPVSRRAQAAAALKATAALGRHFVDRRPLDEYTDSEVGSCRRLPARRYVCGLFVRGELATGFTCRIKVRVRFKNARSKRGRAIALGLRTRCDYPDPAKRRG